MTEKKFLAIIPARGGSKRIPKKNIQILAEKPLIAWTIEAAKRSLYIDDTIVTTEDETIADLSKQYGAEIPFLRPKELADDHAGSSEVVRHAIDFLQRHNQRKYEFIVLLQPTSPLRNHNDIDRAIELLNKKEADAVISVCEVDHSPLWCNTLPTNLSLKNFIPEETKYIRSQDLPNYYRINGAIYICRTSKFLQHNDFFIDDRIYAYIMPKERSIDIDEPLDLIVADAIMKSEYKNLATSG